MQFERDILQNNVLPRIKDFAKQYGRNMELCDLRWGVNSLGMSEEESSTKILQVCFDEIDYARPFFIAIIGDRYGWIPPTYISDNIATERGFSGNIAGKSVTELEILYGTRKDIDSSCIRFYFRTITNKTGWLGKKRVPAYFLSESSSEEQCVKRLKKDLKQNYPDLCRDYNVSWNQEYKNFNGLESFANMLYDDLKTMIIQRWGEVSKLSDYEKQYSQYQYTLSTDVFFEQCQSKVQNFGIDINKIWKTSLTKQIYTIISSNEYIADKIFASLYVQYCKQGYIVIPYDCGQSMTSGFLENMIRYLTEITAKLLNAKYDEPIIEEKDEHSVSSLVERFHGLLEAVDKKTKTLVIFTIRGLQYLDDEDILSWIPLSRYQKIHFVISRDQNIVGPTSYREASEVFYLPEKFDFDRNTLIAAYMKRFRKELDEHVRRTIILKSKYSDFQYMELLMQRLLILSQPDFEKIQKHGDGIESISAHLVDVINETPDTLEDILSSQIEFLYTEIGKELVESVLAILATLPYGILKQDLLSVFEYYNISYNELSLTILRRSLSVCINETLDGYLRLTHSTACSILKTILWEKIAEWGVKICSYLDSRKASRETGSSLNALYASQYLVVAQKANNDQAIASYLRNVNREEYDYNAILKRTLITSGFNTWIKQNVDNFNHQEIEWFVIDFYRYLSEKSAISNDKFYDALLGILGEIIPRIETGLTSMARSEDSYLYFRALFMAGELTWQVDDEKSKMYLKKAKEVSRKEFLHNPNRIWKKVHGIELTDEEKRRGYDYYESLTNQKVDGEVLFGFSGESEDFVSEQSWSNEVRIINNYLADIARRQGNIQMSKLLEQQAELITQTADPDPLNEGNTKVNSYLSIILPNQLDDFQNERKTLFPKRRYKPDYRRNSAIQICKKASSYLKEGRFDDALIQYEKANTILYEIFADGESGLFYDLDDVVGNVDVIKVKIQKECARDLGINYASMLRCISITEEDSRIFEYIKKMIGYGEIYDDHCNNLQSKSTLEENYLNAAKIYMSLDNIHDYADTILQYIDKYLTYRVEAHQKGEKTDESIMEERKSADTIIYTILTTKPEMGSDFVNRLLEQSNETVTANDFNGFVDLTNLARNLLQWMYSHSYTWKGDKCSLESIYVNNTENQCMIWEQHGMHDRLKADVDILCSILPNITNAENIVHATLSIMRYFMVLFREGEYATAVQYAEKCILALKNVESEVSVKVFLDVYSKMVPAYSESAQYESAIRTAVLEEKILDELMVSDDSDNQRIAITERIILYLNYAIIYSRKESLDEAKEYLNKAEALASEYSEIAAAQNGLIERIHYFRKNGLPKSKTLKNPEKEYRFYKSKIEQQLSRYMRSSYSISDLKNVEEDINRLLAIPEHEIFGDAYPIAKYYHVLSMLYSQKGMKPLAKQCLLNSVRIADQDNCAEELYGTIFNDICGYEENVELKLKYVHKALAVFETLRKEGKEYSQNSYAMSLYNAAIILLECHQYQKASDKAEKALFIWKRLYMDENNNQLINYISEAERLLKFLKNR